MRHANRFANAYRPLTKLLTLLLALSLGGLNGLCTAQARSPAESMPRLIPAASPAGPLDGSNRIPLILVHGIHPRVRHLYSWQGFLETARQDPDFSARYQPYLFVYPPAHAVSENAKALQAALQTFDTSHPGHPPYRFVALSLGGLIVKQALDTPGWQNKTDRIIALGVPFHGSPLATPDWLQAQLRQHTFLSPLRRTSGLAYRLTRRKFPHFTTDFCWDNFDGSKLPDACQSQGKVQEPLTDIAPKYVFYAAFFGADPTQQQWLSERLGLIKPIQSPQAEVLPSVSDATSISMLSLTETIPPAASAISFPGQSQALPEQPHLNARRRNPFSRHVLFRWIQPCLSKLPLRDQAPHDDLPVLAFNDGISPISSQLWLGRFVSTRTGTQPLAQRDEWEAVAALARDPHARLFEGMDHRDWLEGKTRYRSKDARLQDWLHPDEARRTVYQWLLHDLRN